MMMIRTPIDLGAAIRDRRRRLQLDQDELAARVGVSRKWVIDVEKGKPRAELGLVLRTLDALGLKLALDAETGSAVAGTGSTVAGPDIDQLLDRMRGKGS